ncbi:MAG TPA: PilZ domain-containing protein [Nitrospiraceae bacterium]|nr:PilZ domain-containing protein [Nitrospiraceae bacterium]
MEGRKHTRFAMQLPVSFSGDQFSGEGTILNVSAEGCAITSDAVAGAGVYLQLTMQLREGDEPTQIDLAAVRWVSASRFGVEFIKIRPNEGERLKKFIKALESTT